MVYTTMEYYSTIAKNEIMPFAATWINLEIIILKVKEDRKRQIPSDITYIWKLKYDTNELIYKTCRLTDRENHLMITKGEGRRDKLGAGFNVYILLYLK